VLHWGRAASPPDARAIVALIDRYYAVAAHGDGATACSLIYAPLARSLPEDLGRGGPRYLRGGRTCAAVVAKLFSQNHFQLIPYDAGLRVDAVRVMGVFGLATLSFHRLPDRVVEVIRDRSVWRMYAPLDGEMP
jgi:hypothetical protein